MFRERLRICGWNWFEGSDSSVVIPFVLSLSKDCFPFVRTCGRHEEQEQPFDQLRRTDFPS
jgi:hypothetical protein